MGAGRAQGRGRDRETQEGLGLFWDFLGLFGGFFCFFLGVWGVFWGFFWVSSGGFGSPPLRKELIELKDDAETEKLKKVWGFFGALWGFWGFLGLFRDFMGLFLGFFWEFGVW